MGYIPPKNIYDATIGDRKLKVDIYDLPYAEFSAENPLVVFGNVVLSDKTRSTNLDNVKIIGDLDISKQKQMIIFPRIVEGAFICRSNTQMRSIDNPKIKVDIFDEHFVFPQGVIEIDCSHSIPSLTYLMDRIPFATRKIIVADALFNNLQGTDLINAHLLLQRYPNLEIVGEKKGKTLSEVLANTPMEAEKPVEKPVVVEPVQKPVEEKPIKLKTTDWWDAVDILDIIRKDKRRKSFKILDSTLERKIRDLIKKFDYQTLQKENSGVSVICIHKDNVHALIEDLMINLEATAKKKTKPAPKPVVTPAVEAKPVARIEVPEEKPAVQTEDFCSLKDIIAQFKEDEVILSFDFTDTELVKEIRKHMKTFNRPKLLNEQTGSNACCISAENVPLVRQKVIEALQKAARKKATKPQPVKKGKTVKKQVVASVEKKPEQVILKTTKHSKARPIAIKKYIPKNLWKKIIRLCNRNDDVCISILENIAAINTDPCETVDSTHVHIIDPKTHIRTTSSYVKRETNQSLVQGLSNSLQDDKRIVWSYIPEEKIIVCVGVLKEHTNTKNTNNYSVMRDNAADGRDIKGKKITLQRVLDEEYLDVDFLLKQYKEQEKQNKSTSATRSGTNTEAVLTQQKQQTPENVEKLNTTAEVGSDIVPILADEEPVKKTYISPAPKIEEKDVPTEAKTLLQIETPQNLSDVRVAEEKVKIIIALLNKAIKENLKLIEKEENIAKQIAQLDTVRDAMLQKAKLQAMLSEIGKADEILKVLQLYTNSNIK